MTRFLRERSYGAILVDPPWRFQTWERPTEITAKGNKSIEHYRTMTFNDIVELRIDKLAKRDCALFMWAINPMLPQALRAMSAWGFAYKTVAFTWAKTTVNDKWHVGLGYWTRANSELCLLGTVGKPKRLAKDVRQLVIASRREHSRKPDVIRANIERLVDGPYAEIFARERRPGWDCFGDQADHFQ